MKITMLQRTGEKLYAHVDMEITAYIAPDKLIELNVRDWDKLVVHMDCKENTEASGIYGPHGFVYEK